MATSSSRCSGISAATPSAPCLTAEPSPSRSTRRTANWRIRFQDTGAGISPQLIEKIFEPFQSGFEGGTGLGLAIVYRIIQAHEAQITVRSEPGQGN